jgi:hypothetical protein
MYWICTVLFGGFMIFSGIPNITGDPQSTQFMHDLLGYPLYFITFIGVAKVLGGITLIIPLPAAIKGVKEWAYAGLFFDLIGAVYSVGIKVGWDMQGIIMMILLFAVGITSYITHKKRT